MLLRWLNIKLSWQPCIKAVNFYTLILHRFFSTDNSWQKRRLIPHFFLNNSHGKNGFSTNKTLQIMQLLEFK